MIAHYTGLYEELSLQQQQAIHELTLERYLRDCFKLHRYLEDELHLAPGLPEYESAYAAHRRWIGRFLGSAVPGTVVAAVFAESRSGVAALCAFRIVCGTRVDRIDQTIGDAHSTIPTHRLLQGFRYPHVAEWDQTSIAEAQICEVTRLVKIDPRNLMALHADGYVSKADIAYLAHQAFAVLFAAAHRLCKEMHPDMAGYVTNMRPMVAGLLCAGYHLDWRALPSDDGIRPTDLALTPGNPDVIYFGRQAASFRALFPGGPRDWRLSDADIEQSELSLPFLLVCNAELEATLEAPVATGWLVRQPAQCKSAVLPG